MNGYFVMMDNSFEHSNLEVVSAQKNLLSVTPVIWPNGADEAGRGIGAGGRTEAGGDADDGARVPHVIAEAAVSIAISHYSIVAASAAGAAATRTGSTGERTNWSPSITADSTQNIKSRQIDANRLRSDHISTQSVWTHIWRDRSSIHPDTKWIWE